MNEADVSVDFSSSETIQPLVIVPRKEGQRYRAPCLQYIPSIKCFVYLTNPQLLTFANDSNFATQHSIRIHQANDDLNPAIFSLHSEKNLLVLGVPSVYFEYDHRIPAHVQFVKVPQNHHEVIRFKPTQFVKPYLYNYRIHEMKIFPDGSRLIVAYSNDRNDSWCKIFTLPESLDDEGNHSEEWTEERWSVPTNSKTVPYEEVDIFKQGFPTIDEADEKMNDEGLTEEEYFTLYNARYYSSNLDNGYFCLAISPDTTRILAGTNDAEIYVIDSTTLKVLLCKRAYGFCKTVTGCHYNPLSGHEEFAVCNEIGVFDIWNVTTLDDGSEEASKIHHLKFPPGTSNCVYSPDGQFIALTSGKESKTYIISSTSAKVMFTLLYPAPEDSSYNTYFCASSLFFGNSCQVATYHDDHVICLWKLPVIYSLKTLCLIFLRASIKYNDIEELCVPTSLKQRLKYLYV